VSAPAKIPVVVRRYEPSPDPCARALEVLLSPTVSKKAAGPAAEPDGRNDAAIVRDTEGVSHVEQKPDRPFEVT
jgi:hypothetical protein